MRISTACGIQGVKNTYLGIILLIRLPTGPWTALRGPPSMVLVNSNSSWGKGGGATGVADGWQRRMASMLCFCATRGRGWNPWDSCEGSSPKAWVKYSCSCPIGTG